MFRDAAFFMVLAANRPADKKADRSLGDLSPDPGAEGGARTRTESPPRDFKSRVSAIPPLRHAKILPRPDRQVNTVPQCAIRFRKFAPDMEIPERVC